MNIICICKFYCRLLINLLEVLYKIDKDKLCKIIILSKKIINMNLIVKNFIKNLTIINKFISY